jgi:putative phosphoesterase
MTRIGLISDTHGLFRPECVAAFAGVDRILHAGDVGDGVLEVLAAIAPVMAVSGNVDLAGASRLGAALDLEVDGVTIHVSHGHELGRPTPEILLARYGAGVIVYGHTHEPLLYRMDGRLVVNPGAAGPARFHVRPTVARLTINRGTAEAEIVYL